MRILDPMIEALKSRVDIKSICQSYFPEWRGNGCLVHCPWHNDTKASLQVFADGGVKCHGCGKFIPDIAHLVAEMEEMNISQAKDYLYRTTVKTISSTLVEKFHDNIFKPRYEDVHQHLNVNRNLPDYILKEFKMGYDPKSQRITIPIFDTWGYCVNIRLMAWKPTKGGKATSYKKGGGIRLYPEHLAWKEPKMLLVEGEFDALCARQFGLPAVTWTGGCNSWNKEHEWVFRDKMVWVRYDADRAGREAVAKHVLPKLKGLALAVEEVPVDRLSPKTNGKDITDWSFKYPLGMTLLAQEMKRKRMPKKEAKKEVCPMCGQVVKKRRRKK